MNNFYVLSHLTKALKKTCEGLAFQFSVSPHKDVWEGYFGNNHQTLRVIFSANPRETALFPDQFRAPKSNNVTAFFTDLKNKEILQIFLEKNDRFLTFVFNNEQKLLFQLFGNQPNIFLIQDDKILESFKSPDDNIGKKPPQPRQPSPGSQSLPDNINPKKAIIRTNPKFPRHLIPHIIDHYKLGEKPPEEIRKLTVELTEIMKDEPQFRILADGNICLLPEHYLPSDNLKLFDEIIPAIRFAYYKTSRERRLSAKLQTIRPKIESKIRKLESTLRELKHTEKGLERAETYEQFGHILMAHAHQNAGNEAETMTLPNFYDGNKPVEIPINNRISIAENAQYYYDKSSRSIRNVEESKRRRKEIKKQLADVIEIRHSIEQVVKIYEFDDWFKENETNMQQLGILPKKSSNQNAPYRKFSLDGFEIWLGRNARSNDKLTSDAHKEDIWMHARGVSGSHLVVRMNNTKEMPPKNVLLKAASIAAWNSKARGAGLAPVIITKRKYVTKPRGAPPGTVRVQREQVEMVEPKEFRNN